MPADHNVESPAPDNRPLTVSLRWINFTALVMALACVFGAYTSWRSFQMSRESRIVEQRFRETSEAFYDLQEAITGMMPEPVVASARRQYEDAQAGYEAARNHFRVRWLD